MTEVRLPGMDHDHYQFRALPESPRFVWPDGARIAVTITLYVDVWEAVIGAKSSHDRRIQTHLGPRDFDLSLWSTREYGARVGIFRVLDLLARYRVRPSVALGSEAARHYPEVIADLAALNGCWLGHGTFSSRRITSLMSEDEERSFIAEATAGVEQATGVRPRGWAGQDFNESTLTPIHLAEAGYMYTTDWSNDDRPFVLGPYAGRSLVALPAHSIWNDIEAIQVRGLSPNTWAKSVTSAFTYLHREVGGSFNIGLNPWVIGQPSRIKHLDQVLTAISANDAAWLATTDDVATVAWDQLINWV